jgi:hypothetical protein
MREVPVMAGVLDEYRQCRITKYQIVTGYYFNVTGGSPTGAVLADHLRRVTTFYLSLTDSEPNPEGGPVTDAVVEFGDRGPGPVTSVGQVFQQGDGSLRVEVLLPREDFQAFWHAIRDVRERIDIGWNESREVVAFAAWGYERLAPDEESRKRIDSLREELGANVGSQ